MTPKKINNQVKMVSLDLQKQVGQVNDPWNPSLVNLSLTIAALCGGVLWLHPKPRNQDFDP